LPDVEKPTAYVVQEVLHSDVYNQKEFAGYILDSIEGFEPLTFNIGDDGLPNGGYMPTRDAAFAPGLPYDSWQWYPMMHHSISSVLLVIDSNLYLISLAGWNDVISIYLSLHVVPMTPVCVNLFDYLRNILLLTPQFPNDNYAFPDRRLGVHHDDLMVTR
jgi:hypothetical protein